MGAHVCLPLATSAAPHSSRTADASADHHPVRSFPGRSNHMLPASLASRPRDRCQRTWFCCQLCVYCKYVHIVRCSGPSGNAAASSIMMYPKWYMFDLFICGSRDLLDSHRSAGFTGQLKGSIARSATTRASCRTLGQTTRVPSQTCACPSSDTGPGSSTTAETL